MFKNWREESPVVFDAEKNTYALTKYQDISFAFKSPELFTSSKGARANGIPQPFMIDADDPSHRRQRRIVEKSFTPGQMAYYSKQIEETARKLIIGSCEDGEFDLVQGVLHKIPVISIAQILGVPSGDYYLLQKWGQAMVEGADGWENVTDEVISAVVEWYEYFDDLAKFKRNNPDGGLISQLLSAHYDDDEITYNEAGGNALALLVGGNETARYLLSNSMYELLRNRENFEILKNDKSLIDSAVEECIRYCVPVMSSVRHAVEDINISGEVIKKDSQVMLMIPSANRDENIFNNPEKFDISRSPNKHIGFGFGIHYCLGASLARMQLKVSIQQIIDICGNIQIADNFSPNIKYSTFLRGVKNLEVIV
jgi:cytochrome P450 family 142 subfamily A polypeptide 1